MGICKRYLGCFCFVFGISKTKQSIIRIPQSINNVLRNWQVSNFSTWNNDFQPLLQAKYNCPTMQPAFQGLLPPIALFQTCKSIFSFLIKERGSKTPFQISTPVFFAHSPRHCARGDSLEDGFCWSKDYLCDIILPDFLCVINLHTGILSLAVCSSMLTHQTHFYNKLNMTRGA